MVDRAAERRRRGLMKDKRKARRRRMRYTAWIVLAPDQLHGCVMADVSDTGGRIDVEESDKIPDEFVLCLARNGSARRKCRVVWRMPRQIGVAFDRPIFDPEQAALVPVICFKTDRRAKKVADTGIVAAKSD
jgi:hypothetical protein